MNSQLTTGLNRGKMVKGTGTAEIIYDDLFSTILQDSETGQIFVSHDEDLHPDVLADLWSKLEIGYEVIAQHFDTTEKRECFTLDRIKP